MLFRSVLFGGRLLLRCHAIAALRRFVGFRSFCLRVFSPSAPCGLSRNRHSNDPLYAIVLKYVENHWFLLSSGCIIAQLKWDVKGFFSDIFLTFHNVRPLSPGRKTVSPGCPACGSAGFHRSKGSSPCMNSCTFPLRYTRSPAGRTVTTPPRGEICLAISTSFFSLSDRKSVV